MTLRYTVGADLGGTKTAAAVVKPTGDIGPIVRVATRPGNGAAWVLQQLAHAVRACIHQAGAAPTELSGIGVGAAGIFDAAGVVVAGNDTFPGWIGTPVARLLAEEFGVPTAVVNDVNAHALGEFQHGPAAGASPLVVVAVGTGVGIGTIIDGHLVPGKHGAAGEIGHMPSRLAHNRPCPCGQTGHLEGVACGPAMQSAYTQAGGTAATFRQVVQQAHRGDGLALAVVEHGATALAEAIAAIATVLDPEAFVVTGGVASAGPPWWHPLGSHFNNLLIPLQRRTQLLQSHQQQTAAILGASQALQQFLNQPEPANRGEASQC